MARKQLNIRLSDDERSGLVKLAEKLHKEGHIKKATLTELIRGIVSYVDKLGNKIDEV